MFSISSKYLISFQHFVMPPCLPFRHSWEHTFASVVDVQSLPLTKPLGNTCLTWNSTLVRATQHVMRIRRRSNASVYAHTGCAGHVGDPAVNLNHCFSKKRKEWGSFVNYICHYLAVRIWSSRMDADAFQLEVSSESIQTQLTLVTLVMERDCLTKVLHTEGERQQALSTGAGQQT